MKFKNLCFYDFETTGLNHKTCDVLQLGFMCGKSLNSVFYRKSIFIQFNKPFLECTSSEIKGLAFNNIHNQEDLNEHNKKSIPLKDALEIFVKTIQKVFEFQSFTLIGYNNFSYDNKILSRFLTTYDPDNFYFMLENSYDLYKFICNSRKFDDITSTVWNKNFGFENRKLETIFPYIFKKDFKAHDALEDVRATLKLFKYYSIKFPTHLEYDFINSFESYGDLNEFQSIDMSNLIKEENK